MKLLNRTIFSMSLALLAALTSWAVIFYVNMIDEVHDSIDDGLDNSRLLVIRETEKDSTLFSQFNFDEGNYSIWPMPEGKALSFQEEYKDTLMYMQNEMDLEPVRLLTTVFKTESGKFYKLKIISSMVEEDDLIEDLFYSLLWLYLILIVTILGINFLVLRSLWKPFYVFLERIKQFKLGKQEKIEPVETTITEFQNLNKVVLDVLGNNVRSYHSQKQLIENTSHEIQTPLAIALNKLELLADNPDLSEEAVTEVFKIIETLQRLSGMNRSLMLLSKIENQQFAETSEIDIKLLVQKVMTDFQDLLEFKEIQVKWLGESELKVSMHPDLALILISNLVKNAIRHNEKGGVIELEFLKDVWILRNTGVKVSLDSEKIFDRFVKSSSENNSTGLGLAICRSIATVSGFEIDYVFNRMHEFHVRF